MTPQLVIALAYIHFLSAPRSQALPGRLTFPALGPDEFTHAAPDAKVRILPALKSQA
jgi:hypothetical protein